MGAIITIEKSELNEMLTEAARIGATIALNDHVVYSLGDACKKLGITYSTLQKRIHQGKIKAIDGKITGAEIRKYLNLQSI